MTMSSGPPTATTMSRISALLSHTLCIVHFAAIRSLLWFCLLAVCVFDVLCFVVLLIGSQCLPSAHEARRNDLDVHATSGDRGNVEREPATVAESADAAGSMDVAESVQDVVESTELATACGNVRNLIRKFEIVEKTGVGAQTDGPSESTAAVRYNCGPDGSRKTSRVDQPSAGVVELLVKRFDGSEKIPVLDDKPSQLVINKSSTEPKS